MDYSILDDTEINSPSSPHYIDESWISLRMRSTFIKVNFENIWNPYRCILLFGQLEWLFENLQSAPSSVCTCSNGTWQRICQKCLGGVERILTWRLFIGSPRHSLGGWLRGSGLIEYGQTGEKSPSFQPLPIGPFLRPMSNDPWKSSLHHPTVWIYKKKFIIINISGPHIIITTNWKLE